MRRIHALIGAALALSLAAACTPPPAFSPMPPTPNASAPVASLIPSPSTTPSPAPPLATSTSSAGGPPEAGLPPGQAGVVAAAAADLAERAGVAVDDIELLTLIADDLPATDLGCPRKGAPDPVQPAFVTGWIIHLRAAADTYEYRAHGSLVVYCGPAPAP